MHVSKVQKKYGVIIVGAGHAGAQAALALRQNGYSGSIGLFGKESHPPYQRPPLSKEYLSGEKEFERILICPVERWAEKDIDLILGCEVLTIDVEGRYVTTAIGDQIEFEKLIWAGGGSPRRLNCDGSELAGVHSVRSRSDVDAIMADLGNGSNRAVIIGGGYIGLEAASALRKLDCEVTVLEALPRVLARVAGHEISEFIQNVHRQHGVDLRLSTSLEALEGEKGQVSAALLSNGERIACDLVIVGIGIDPDIAPLIEAGAKTANGVCVDQYCMTSIPDCYAIGDCAEHANPFAEGRRIRLESVQNANDMASTAAKHICGKDEPYMATPWFWSNQYDVKLQTVGLALDYDDTVVRGAPGERKFSVLYLKDRKLIALDAVNLPKDYVQGRKLIESKRIFDRTQLVDASVPLKSLM